MRPATPIRITIEGFKPSFNSSFSSRILLFAAGLAILFCLIPGGQAHAVKANPEPLLAVQPDGSLLKIYLFGDEYLHWNTDETGYPVILSADGKTWVYARQELGRLLPTSHIAGSVDPASVGLSKPDIKSLKPSEAKPDRLQSGSEDLQMFPPAGTMRNLVVLVNYTDLTVTSTRQQFDDLFNQTGYSTDGAFGSVKDYFSEVSHGALVVQSTVVEPVTVSQGYAYYGANNIYGYDVRPRTMVQEALAALEARGFDFTTVDGDGDGWVDGLTIIHAGGGEEYSGNDPNYIWSHQAYLSTTLIYDGIRMRPYHTEPARRGWDSSPSTWGITRIGVICHETGHFLGLPDLYDYDYDSEGVGNFCLMAGGSWNGSGGTTPSHPSAFCKEGLGWSIPSLISAGGFYAISQAETSTNLYKIRVGFAGNEYFLIENRQGVGFDSALPGSNRGLLIWHIDSNQPDNDDQTHFLVDLEEASGTQHLELNQNSGDDADYFREGNATEFTGTSVPNNISYTNEACAFDIRSISASGTMMSFVVNGMIVTVTSPSGGEVLQVGDVHVISWTVEGDIPDSIGISLSLDSGANYDRTVATGLVGANTYGWTVPNLPVNSARIKVVAYADGAAAGSDTSDEDFTIKGFRRYVSLTGGNVYPYSLPAWAARTIQNAVNAADPGDSILVEAGTYTSAVAVDRPVLLYGGWSPGFVSRDPSLYVTKIQAGGSTVSFVSIASGSPGIEGFTITGGTGTAAILPANGIYGGGIFVYGSPAAIRDNIITNCGFTSVSGFSGGGGIACYDGSVTIENNSITGCRAQSGGGIYLYQATATISGNTISGSLSNLEYSGTRNGGAVYALHSNVAMSGNVIISNTGYREGGGIYARLSTLSTSGDSILSNQSLTNGAGLCGDHSPVSIANSVIKGNESSASGGGIWHKGERLDIVELAGGRERLQRYRRRDIRGQHVGRMGQQYDRRQQRPLRRRKRLPCGGGFPRREEQPRHVRRTERVPIDRSGQHHLPVQRLLRQFPGRCCHDRARRDECRRESRIRRRGARRLPARRIFRRSRRRRSGARRPGRFEVRYRHVRRPARRHGSSGPGAESCQRGIGRHDNNTLMGSQDPGRIRLLRGLCRHRGRVHPGRRELHRFGAGRRESFPGSSGFRMRLVPGQPH